MAKRPVEEMTNELMAIPSVVMIGSRGLGLEHWEDTDLVIMIDDLPDGLEGYKSFDISRYFKVVPLGNHYLIKAYDDTNSKLDVIVMDNRKVVNQVRQAMSDIKYVPRYIMEYKEERIKMFELALEHAISTGKG